MGGALARAKGGGLGQKVKHGLGLGRTGEELGSVLTTDQPPEHSIGVMDSVVPTGTLLSSHTCIKPVLFSDRVVAEGVVEGPRWAATLPELEPKAVATPWYQVRQFFLGCRFSFPIQAGDHQAQDEHPKDPQDKNLQHTFHVWSRRWLPWQAADWLLTWVREKED